MKKLLVLALSIFLALPVIAMAQTPATQSSSQSQGNDTMGQAPSGAAKTAVKGTISEDGKTLVGDAGGKSWTIANPDAVKGHEGHHVELKGNADASTGSIQVTSVKMQKAEKGSTKKDTTPQQ
jgi:hypothetical protein